MRYPQEPTLSFAKQFLMETDDAAKRGGNRHWMIAWDRTTKDLLVARLGLEREIRRLLEPVWAVSMQSGYTFRSREP
jgi:hypothetical protein